MPYVTKTDEILTGGVNLLSPSDQLRDEHALVVQNFRSDEHGALHSRPGSDRYLTISAGANIHSMSHSGGGPSFYLGVDNQLYREASSIDSGYDGKPLGIVGFRRFAWIMSPAKQRKDDASTLTAWLPDKPAGKPVATPTSLDAITIAAMESSEAWVTDDQLDKPNPYFDNTKIAEGATSLRFVTDAAGTPSATLTFGLPKDLSIGGRQNDEDVVTLWINCLDARQVDNVVLLVDVDDGTFSQNFYTATIAQEALNPAGQEWSDISVIRKLPEGDVTRRIGFTRTGDDSTKDWTTVSAIKISAQVNEATQLHFDQCFISGGISGDLEGEYRWVVTFENEEGHETNPSEISETVRLDRQYAALSAIPTPTPGQGVTRRNIYRGGGSLTAFYRVGVLNDDVSTAWTDKVSDDDATALGIILEIDHDPPPPAQGLAGPYFEKLLAWNSGRTADQDKQFKNRLWWCKTSRPWYWPGSDNAAAGNHVDVGEDGEDILDVQPHKRVAWIYKTGSIWRLVGDPDDGELEQTNAHIGVAGALAVANAGAVDYFVGANGNGIFSFNGDREERVSAAIDPIFRGQYVRLYDGTYAAPVDADNAWRIATGYAYGKVYVSYPTPGSPSGANSETVILDTRTGRWYQYKLGADFQSTGFTSFTYSTSTGQLFGATLDGNVLTLEPMGSGINVDDFGGNNREIPLVYQSGYRNQGLPDNEKLYEDVIIEHNTSFIPAGGTGALLTLTAYFNKGASNVVLGQIRSSAPSRTTFQINAGLGQRAYDISIRIAGDNTNSEVVLSKIFIHYKVEPRLGKSYDSGVLDSGTDQVKQLEELEFELEASEQLDWKVYSDMPGGDLTLKAAAPLISPATRKTSNIYLTTPVEGKRLRITIGSVGDFRLYSGRARIKPIGEYIDGALGDFWDSGELMLT